MQGIEVRQALTAHHVNLNQLAKDMGITPQALFSRFNAHTFRQEYLQQITAIIGKDIFGLGTDKATGQQPIFDIRVCAGSGNGLYEDDNNKVVEYVQIPAFAGCTGVTIYGDSMYPQYRPGDVVFVRQCISLEDIDYGQTYIIITRSDRLIKNIYESSKGVGYIRLCSFNAETNPAGERLYPDYDLSFENILFLYKVVGSLRRSQL